MKNAFFLLVAVVVCSSATIRNVPAGYATIQTAINASVHGDTVLVQPGTYFENINYRGKNIVVTSRFCESNDVQFIYSTVINGSKPSHPDTASVVLFINHEDSSAVIQGFTITGGKGTAWPDEHSAGTFVEGGGILAALASPKIMHNLIINNEAVAVRNGIVSAGGGGIRIGDGNPTIANNTIMNNRGKYGAGIVANYTGAIIRNNIIVGNSGGGDYGGGGVWLNGSGPKPKYLENNTIVGNQSVSDGGGLLLLDPTAAAVVRNNIIWGNTGVSGSQISLREAATIASSYNDIQGWSSGGTNVNVAPMFDDSLLLLAVGSPLIDAGDTVSSYQDPGIAGLGKFPSRGTMRNDIGAYGGPGAELMPVLSLSRFVMPQSAVNFGKLRPDSISTVVLRMFNTGTAAVRFDSVRLSVNMQKNITLSRPDLFQLPLAGADSIMLQWHPMAAQTLQDTLLVYHNDTAQLRPLRIPLSGKAFTITPAVKGTMYAGTGAADSAKLYSIDTSASAAQLIGKTGFTQIISLRTNPKTGELIALVNSATPQLMRISAANAESFSLPQLALTNPKGMVFRSDGTLLIGTFSGTVYSVNMTTGAVASVGSNGLRIAGLAFNPVNGSLWMSVRPPSTGRDNIYKLNPATMQATLVGSTGYGIAVKDITFDNQGRLFGVMDTTGGQSYLIQINTETGKGNMIGGLAVKGIETIELQSGFVASSSDSKTLAPAQFALAQNFPNPFNPSTTIGFSLRSSAVTTLKVYDILGKEIATVVNSYLSAGEHQVPFDAGRLASGIYFYTLRSGADIQTKKMTVLK
jgi:hypothetical protein